MLRIDLVLRIKEYEVVAAGAALVGDFDTNLDLRASVSGSLGRLWQFDIPSQWASAADLFDMIEDGEGNLKDADGNDVLKSELLLFP